MLLGESFSRYAGEYSFEAKILQHVRPLQQLHFLLIPANKLPLSCRAIKDYIRCSLEVRAACSRVPLARLFHACFVRLAGDGDKQLQSATRGQRWMTQGEGAFSFPPLPKCSVTVLE